MSGTPGVQGGGRDRLRLAGDGQARDLLGGDVDGREGGVLGLALLLRQGVRQGPGQEGHQLHSEVHEVYDHQEAVDRR